MVNLAYHLAKSVEYMSERLGTGKFEVSDNWQCSSCAALPQPTSGEDENDREAEEEEEGLCVDCQDSWVAEVETMEYSDAFEKRVNITVGFASIVMGAVAVLGNRSLGGVWEEGVLIGLIADWCVNRMPAWMRELPPPIHALLNYSLISAFLLCTTAIVCSTLVSCFVMAMNPGSDRHWRHMTLGVYFIILAQTMLYGFALWVGVTGVEIMTVVGPVVLGLGALGCWACMRGDGEKEGGIRCGDEEKGMKTIRGEKVCAMGV